MAKTFREWKPEQTLMFPPTPMDWVSKDDLVLFIRNLVMEELDLSEIEDQYQEERGYPPFHPVMMTGLVLYSYCQGIYSSRRIARACKQRVDFLALTGMQKPDHRTVNLFRKRHLKALSRLFEQVLQLCDKAGLVKLGHVAVDGTKIRANASKQKTMSYATMKKLEERYKTEVERWFAEAERIDREEDELYGADKSGDELPEWVSNKEERLKRIRQAKAELEAEAKAAAEREPDPNKTGHKAKPTGTPSDKQQRNLTDTESRLMKSGDNFIQGYNAQVAVDGYRQIIVAQSLNNNGSDMHQMIPLLKQIRIHLRRQAKEVSSDSGYCSQLNLKELQKRRIRGYVATQMHRKHRKVGRWIQRMRQRLRQGARRSRYRLRKQIVEPVFGQIKQGRGFRQFLLRGEKNVACEWSLLCTAHNLLKLAAAKGSKAARRAASSALARRTRFYFPCSPPILIT
jgi:transposase